MLLFLLPLFALALIMLPFFVMLKRRKEGKPLKTRKAILINAGSFIGVMVMMSVFVPLFAFASAEGAAEAAQTALSVGDGLKYLGAALATGLATIGTGIAVGYRSYRRKRQELHEGSYLRCTRRRCRYLRTSDFDTYPLFIIAERYRKMKFFLISDNTDTQMGMRLAGIEGIVVSRPEEVTDALEKAKADKDIGVVLMTEKLINMCKQTVYDMKLNSTKPLIVEIPDRHGTSDISKSIDGYVRDAIGLKL